jgi:hypothetical protein
MYRDNGQIAGLLIRFDYQCTNHEKTENTHVTEYLANLRTGDEVTTSADDSVGRVYITALCWVGLAKICCERHGPFPIFDFDAPCPFLYFNPSAHIPSSHRGHLYASFRAGALCVHAQRSSFRNFRHPIRNSSDIVAFSELTNSCCPILIQSSTNFCSAFEAELGDVVPVVHTSIGAFSVPLPVLYPSQLARGSKFLQPPFESHRSSARLSLRVPGAAG